LSSSSNSSSALLLPLLIFPFHPNSKNPSSVQPTIFYLLSVNGKCAPVSIPSPALPPHVLGFGGGDGGCPSKRILHDQFSQGNPAQPL
jgi:hypothetical protein